MESDKIDKGDKEMEPWKEMDLDYETALNIRENVEQVFERERLYSEMIDELGLEGEDSYRAFLLGFDIGKDIGRQEQTRQAMNQVSGLAEKLGVGNLIPKDKFLGGDV